MRQPRVNLLPDDTAPSQYVLCSSSIPSVVAVGADDRLLLLLLLSPGQGKARLGAIVHQKNAAALAVTGVKNEDQREFAKLVDSVKSQFNDGARVQWGGGECCQQQLLGIG
jgi:hypothetical protein